MRQTGDRIRHAVLFEAIALAIVAPLGTLVFGVGMVDFGVVALASATIAMGWNYVYNLIFDHALRRWRGSVRKTLPIRVLHAVLFEGGLLCLFVPAIALYLGVTLWQALTMDVALAVFYTLFAFVYNWGYDLTFPIAD